MILMAVCKDFLLRGEASVAELLQAAFHVFEDFGLGVEDFRRLCYEVAEVVVDPAELVDGIVV